MPSDHLRAGDHAGHAHGTDAECPGCREACHCDNLPGYPNNACAHCPGHPDKACVHCRLVYLGIEP